MTATNYDIRQYLLRFDVELICDLLEISAEDLLDRFEDFIDVKHEQLAQELEDEVSDGSDEG